MLTLPPFPPQRSVLVSFWLVFSCASGLLIGMLASLLFSAVWFASGAALASAMGVLGLLRPQIAASPYRAWNKLAREFARIARLWVTGLCYYCIFVVVGQTRSPMRLTQPTPGESLWVSRGKFARPLYSHPNGIAQEVTRQSWIRSYWSWAMRSGNVWAIGVLPFLMVLAFIEADEPKNMPPADIYTLF